MPIALRVPFALALLSLRQAAAQPALKFTFSADVRDWRVWFNQTSDACNERDTPDQAIAAFRKDDGTVVAFSGDNDVTRDGVSLGGFYRSVGPSLTELKRDCSAPVITGGDESGPPSQFPHSVWVLATWTDDGETVHALVHDEYHADVTDPVSCPAADKSICWYTTILAAKSTDGGKTFAYVTTPDNPRGIVLSSPVGYTPGVEGGHPQGMPNHHLVSDPRDGFLYVVAGCGQDAHLESTKTGICVWRTNDISDIQSWRGWDGEAWAATVADPYAIPAPSPGGHLAAIVGPGSAASGSVTFLESADVFLAVDTHVSPRQGERPLVHVYYQTSTNMTTWSAKRSAGTFDLPEPFVGAVIYPHLMDAASPSRNFDVLGADSTSIYLELITGIPGQGLFRAGLFVPTTIELAAGDGDAELWTV